MFSVHNTGILSFNEATFPGILLASPSIGFKCEQNLMELNDTTTLTPKKIDKYEREKEGKNKIMKSIQKKTIKATNFKSLAKLQRNYLSNKKLSVSLSKTLTCYSYLALFIKKMNSLKML